MRPEDLETLRAKKRAQLRIMGMAGVSAPNDLTFGLSKVLIEKPMPIHAVPRPETRGSPSSAGTLSTVMLLAIIVTTTWLRTGVAHDIVRPLSNVAEIPASPARSSVELLAGQVRG